jgi:hypothetical protein
VERRCERIARSGPLAAVARRTDLLHRLGPAQRRLDVAVAALHELPDPERDAGLRATLSAAIAAAAATNGATGSRTASLPESAARTGMS